jgi:hypothetical protein
MEKEKLILSEKSAKENLQQMLDYYEIDIDDIDDKDTRKAVSSSLKKIIKSIMKGRLEIKIEEEFQVIQYTKNGEKIIYREIDGISKSAMASKGDNDYNGKCYALMGSLSGLGESAIRSLKGVDLSLTEVLGVVFLQV